jgi:hypothetical protein
MKSIPLADYNDITEKLDDLPAADAPLIERTAIAITKPIVNEFIINWFPRPTWFPASLFECPLRA